MSPVQHSLAATNPIPQAARVSVLLPTAVDQVFTYLAPQPLPPGTLVEARLTGRRLIGAVWGNTDDNVPAAKLKPIEKMLEGFPPLSTAFRNWIDWVAEFTLAPKGAVLALAALSLAGKTPRKTYAPPEYKVTLPTLTEPQQKAADAITELIVGMRRASARAASDSDARESGSGGETPPGAIAPILLDGVTGSGKTEVYFSAIAEALKEECVDPQAEPERPVAKRRETSDSESTERGGAVAGACYQAPPARSAKQVLVLVPEIALTHQWFERFTQTFGAAPTVWHSQESPASRTRVWQAVARGEAKVVVGARSALFLPFKNLALIVVDEEQDPSYKQEEGVLYHARDMAVVRAKFEQIPIVLVSATPSLETLHNVEAGRYQMFHLPERYGTAGLPVVSLVDMTLHPPERGEFLSPLVKEKLLTTLASGQQTLLFLNRRGYAPLLLCRACGHRFECEHCSAWLVVHGKKELLCHHCGHHEKLPSECPSCHASADKLAACGPGVERIAEEVRAIFADGERVRRVAEGEPEQSERGGAVAGAVSPPAPKAPTIAILSSDESVAAETWAAIERGEVDILIGTQMAAKGHHFPNLTFVGVIDADVGLAGADLRTAERTYQLLHQLGGRAGRMDMPGQVFIQTYQPSHPVMQALAAHDRDRIMALETLARQAGHWPPFGQLAAILLDGADEAKVRRAGQRIAQSAPQDARITVLGPAPAPLSKLRDQYRYRLLVKARKSVHLQRTLSNWLKDAHFAGVRIKIDINPYYFQ